ncbi:MAG: trypsin-like peptidase domain-containing protein [Rhodothermales bacterium]|nr:trypsin-like peptidase domain-containing protein [Rhodothermales bacterium]
MMRLLPLFLVACTVLGCNNDARSQEQAAPAPQRVEAADDVNDRVSRSRQTAITRAVEAATPAIVSVNVLGVERVRVRDPWADFFSDPFFEQFFSNRRSRVIERQVQNVGSGFVLSPDGYIVTNDHVAGNATRISVSFPDGRTLDAELIGTDKASDIALLKVDPDAALPYLALAEEDRPLVGEWVIALGNPFGLFEAAEPTVTVGVVSAVGRDLSVSRDGRIYRDMIQTDASINRGNSGGPLVNALGEVIGVNTAIYSQSGGSVGIGFAVPAAKVRRIVEELKRTGFVDRSYYTGLRGMDVTERIARALALPEVRGVLLRDVDPGSPAEAAGFLPYDVIVALEGESVDNLADFVARLYDFRPGDRVRCRVLRDGAAQMLTLEIGRQEG